MRSTDTVKLLKECDAGTKMGISSIDDVLDRVCDQGLKALLQESKSHHEKLETELEEELSSYSEEEKEPNAMAKGMSWIKTNVKMGMDESDATVADLLTDGCDMGIKSLYRYLNQYKGAEQEATSIAKRLIDIEAKLETELRKYL